MSKAAKRERQRQNRQARREYEESVDKRQKRWKSVRGFLIILVPIAIVVAFLAIRGGGDDDSKSSEGKSTSTSVTPATVVPTPVTTVAPKANLAQPTMTIDPKKKYTATIQTNIGTIEITLDAKNAPKSVNNFVYLAESGYYDGLLFNRAATDFVVQTGGGDNTTAGGPGYTIQAELPKNKYKVGSVAWAKAGNQPAGTAGSQFFIGTGSGVTSLPKDYGYIGKVTQGMDVAAEIMGFAPSSGDGPPTKDIQMTSVTIIES